MKAERVMSTSRYVWTFAAIIIWIGFALAASGTSKKRAESNCENGPPDECSL